MMKKYFHEISQKEIEKLIKEKKTVRYVIDNYKQPDWCGYHEALHPTFGCWSLCDTSPKGSRTMISFNGCSTCPEFKIKRYEWIFMCLSEKDALKVIKLFSEDYLEKECIKINTIGSNSKYFKYFIS